MRSGEQAFTNLEHGVVGLEAVGAFFPEKAALFVFEAGDVAANAIAALCDDKGADHIGMLGAQRQCLLHQ